MPTTFTMNGSSRFRIRRPRATGNGAASDLDQSVGERLRELDEILGRQNIRPNDVAATGAKATAIVRTDLRDRLGQLLTPKRTEAPSWASGSLVDRFNNAPPGDDYQTLSAYIEATPALLELKYALDSALEEDSLTLNDEASAILSGDYPNIYAYLVTRAFLVQDKRTVDAVRIVLLKGPFGVRNVAEYAIVSAARMMIARKKLAVPDYDNDGSAIVRMIRSADIPLNQTSFEARVRAVVDPFIFDNKEAGYIERSAFKNAITAEMRPLLVRYIRSSPVTIDDSNINFFLPLFISQIAGGVDIGEPTTDTATEAAERDFEVTFFVDDDTRTNINRAAARCAAQLYYTMVLGDELEVFNVVNYFTHRYLIREGFEILDSRLRDDLQMYVFSNKFTSTDDRTNLKRVLDRTRPAERQMFYRQVFNHGKAPVTDDVVVNDEFIRLWKILMLESAKFLQRAQISPNPNSFVSKQGVMQAVEDLQYNLSLHCTGMATVITPLAYEELEFVTKRILMHQEVVRHVAPSGGTWWKVVERLFAEMKKQRPNSTVLNNKAKLGYEILREIADYEPSTFDLDDKFGEFISLVDAFITTQSILQEALTDDLKQADDEDDDYSPHSRPRLLPGMPPSMQPPLMAGSPNGMATKARAADDEWDF